MIDLYCARCGVELGIIFYEEDGYGDVCSLCMYEIGEEERDEQE